MLTCMYPRQCSLFWVTSYRSSCTWTTVAGLRFLALTYLYLDQCGVSLNGLKQRSCGHKSLHIWDINWKISKFLDFFFPFRTLLVGNDGGVWCLFSLAKAFGEWQPVCTRLLTLVSGCNKGISSKFDEQVYFLPSKVYVHYDPKIYELEWNSCSKVGSHICQHSMSVDFLVCFD